MHTVRGVTSFMPPELFKFADHCDDAVGKYSPFLFDIYSLGITMAMIKFLDISMDNPALNEFINESKSGKFERISNHSFTKVNYKEVVQRMIVGDERNRINPNELGLCLNNLDGKSVKVNEDHIVKSMNFKKTYSVDDATRIYDYIAKTYFNLFEWDKWNDKMNEILINFE